MRKSLLLPVVVALFAAAPCAAQEQSSGTVVLDAATQEQDITRQIDRETEAHQLTQWKAESEFLATLSSQSIAARTEAIGKFKENQAAETRKFRARIYEKMSAYREKQHKENLAKLKAQLQKNKLLSDEQKALQIADEEQQFKTSMEYRQKQFKESQKELEATFKAGLSSEERGALKKEYAAKRRTAEKEYYERRENESKVFIEKIEAATARARAAQKKAAAK